MNRRRLLGSLVAATLLGVTPKRAHARRAIRPPGALPPGEFEQACIGCFRCAEVCPPKCIDFSGDWSLATALPQLHLSERACVLCMRCTEACPTDALTTLAASAPVIAAHVKMGTPKLTRSKCLPWNGKGVCRLCYQVCPYPGAAVEVVGPQLAPLFHAEACVGCGLCEEACPDAAQAIVIEPLEVTR